MLRVRTGRSLRPEHIYIPPSPVQMTFYILMPAYSWSNWGRKNCRISFLLAFSVGVSKPFSTENSSGWMAMAFTLKQMKTQGIFKANHSISLVWSANIRTHTYIHQEVKWTLFRVLSHPFSWVVKMSISIIIQIIWKLQKLQRQCTCSKVLSPPSLPSFTMSSKMATLTFCSEKKCKQLIKIN